MKLKIKTITSFIQTVHLKTFQFREVAYIRLLSTERNQGWGEVAPLPNWSQETLTECLEQLAKKQSRILNHEWTLTNWSTLLSELELFPALAFGIESALLSLLSPIDFCQTPVSALLMGSKDEIIHQACLRLREGYTTAKLKVSQLNFKEAKEVIDHLKNDFRLRVDVNRAWPTQQALDFFSQYPLNTFEYIEEPFQDVQDLSLFSHPLAIDESFPHRLSLEKLETLPNLKALIYKPTMQGGLCKGKTLYEWSKERNVSFVLSSSFESDIGLACIMSMAKRLNVSTPLGLGTYHYLIRNHSKYPLESFKGSFKSPKIIEPILNAE